MSASSSELGVAGRKRTVEELVDRLRAKTLVDRLSLLAHLSIGRTLCKLRDAVLDDEDVSPKAAKALLCCGIAMYRRHAVGEQGDEEGEDHEETMALIKQSAVLIFVLLATIEARNGGAVEIDVTREVVERANAATLANVLETRARRKRKAPEHETPAADTGTEAATLAPPPQPPPPAATAGALTMSVLQYVAHMLSNNTSTEHERLANLFFRTSAACMAQNLLLAHGVSDFVSLKATADHPVPRETRLLGIAQAGESEAGQSVRLSYLEPVLSQRACAYLPTLCVPLQILRDLLLSFLLPSGIIGVRRTLMLSRTASTTAGIDHADAVNSAHSCAMAGCEYIWENGTDPLERACAILAGAAVLTTKGGDDPIRKQDAFLGRVSLPFFETRPPASGVKRLALLTDQRRWVLYKVDKKNKPNVLCNLSGFEGLCDCLLEFL